MCHKNSNKINLFTRKKNPVVKEYDDSLGVLLILRTTFWKKAYLELFLSRILILYYKEKKALRLSKSLRKKKKKSIHLASYKAEILTRRENRPWNTEKSDSNNKKKK